MDANPEVPKLATGIPEKELKAVCKRVEFLLIRAGPLFSKRSKGRMMEDVFLRSYGLDGTLEPKPPAIVGVGYSLSKDQVQELIDQIWTGLKKGGCKHSPGTLRRDVVRMQQLSARLALPPEEVFVRYFFQNV